MIIIENYYNYDLKSECPITKGFNNFLIIITCDWQCIITQLLIKPT